MNSTVESTIVAARRELGPALLAIAPTLLALWFGGYHVRHSGWLVIALVLVAGVFATAGLLGTLRSLFGFAATSMALLTVWTFTSMLWADVAAHDAWVEAVRAAGYTAMLLAGGALLASARTYTRYVLFVGASASVLALITAVRLVTSDTPLKLFVAGRLDWPVGYAPGLAALYLIALFLLLGIACEAQQRESLVARVVVGAGALAGAGVCASMAILAQSRGTVLALIVGIIVSLVAMPQRMAWLLRLGLIVGALIVMKGALSEPYRAMFALRQAPFVEGADEQALLAAANAAAAAAGRATMIVFVVLAASALLLALTKSGVDDYLGRMQRKGNTNKEILVVVGILSLSICVGLLLATPAKVPTGASWIQQQWRGCIHPPDTSSDPGNSASHFSNTGTGRCDYYRVALASIRERPLLGLGAGNFRGEYVRERRTKEEPRTVHSLPLQLVTELGVFGGLMGLLTLACVLIASFKFVQSGPRRSATFAGAIGAMAYWVAHASIDWLWQLTAITLPIMALAGGLLACVSPPQNRHSRMISGFVYGAATLVVVVLVLGVTMSDARLRRARDPLLQRQDRAGAVRAAMDAQRFDPTWAEPVITEGALRAISSDRSGAAQSGRRAVKLEPRNWSVLFRASGLIGLDNTQAGLEAYQEARRLNPQLARTMKANDVATRAGTTPDSLQSPDA